jgi:exonuclease SbcC
MITKVRLKNLRSHLDSELVFSAGTNALLGHIGSGKSSVLEGICLGLFGTTPLLQSKKLKLNDMIMNKPIVQSKAEIDVSFQVADKIYSVKRVVEKDKGTTYSELREDGKLLEAPSTQRVTELVEKILKVNYDLFSKVVYSEQNALDYFLTIPKGQRMKKMDELLMIDKFENARASCITLFNKIVERKVGKQSIVEQIDVDQLKKSIDEIKDSLMVNVTEATALKKEQESITRERIRMEKEVSELKALNSQLEALRKEERGISVAAEEMKRSSAVLEESLKGVDPATVEKKLRGVTSFVKEAEAVLSEKEMRHQKLQLQASKDQAELKVLKKELAKIEKELEEKMRIKKEFEAYQKSISEDIEKDLEKRKELMESIVSEVEGAKVRMHDFQDAVQQMASLGGKCPVCESRLTPSKKRTLIKQKKLRIAALKKQLEELVKRKKLTEAEIERLEEAEKKWEEMKKELENLESMKDEYENSKNVCLVLSENVSKAEKELASLEKDLKDLQRKYKIAIEDKQKLEMVLYRLNDYISKKKRVAELLKERGKILEKISEISEKLKGVEVEKEEKQLTNLTVKEKELITRIVGIENLIKEKEVRLKDFEKTLATVEKERKEIEKLEMLVRDMKIFEKALAGVQSELRREFVIFVNYTMNNLWPTLYPYRDFESIRLNIEEGDYVLQLRPKSGDWINVEGVASGGERSIACLALRVAFALVLAPHLRLLILDEPTMNLDSTAVKELATTLRERIGEFIGQTFLITHQVELEDAVTGNAYRLERDKEKDGVTKVIPLISA